ncbi:MAG: hypothetical protein IH609_16045 [Dehalococcoidia bacterium]|jgi:hypothetical protein|nr:hypothetical protein [Dehalococcoidia bacterium]
MNHNIAIETARLQLVHVSRRAELLGSLGEIPQPRPLLPFRRRVVSLPSAIEVRHG